MTESRLIIRLVATALALLAGLACPAGAETYPSRPVKMICWTSAGAPLDVMMRQLAKQLGEILDQTFVVDNRAGGSGAVAMSAVLNAPADGYTLLSTTSSMSFTLATGRVRVEPGQFTVLPAVQAEPSAVAVRADSRFKTLKEVVDYLREKPGGLSVGGFSSAGFHQYVFYRLQQEGKFTSIWIPFKGGQEAGLALLGGHIDVAIMTPSSALAQIQNGDIRLLAISSAERDQFFPEVPTFREQGYDVVEQIWRGVMVKAGTPQPVLDRLIAAIDKIKQTQEWKEFSKTNLQSDFNISLEDMQKLVAKEVASDRAFLQYSGLLK
jgi:tripartite-type tricarboxylate transporter receptor subunit TctC